MEGVPGYISGVKTESLMKNGNHVQRLLGFPAAILFMVVCLPLAGGAGFGAVQDLAGRYQGFWTNTTFGSTGKAVIDIQLAGTNATILFDMDGYVFGAMDPPLISMPGLVQGSQILIDNHGTGMFGSISGTIDSANGTFSAVLGDIPGGGIQRVTATGTIGGGRISLDYEVTFPGPASPTNPAHGVMVATSASPFKITRIYRDSTVVVVEWSGGPQPCQVQTRSNVAAGAWINHGAPAAGYTARVPMDPAGKGFIRIVGQ